MDDKRKTHRQRVLKGGKIIFAKAVIPTVPARLWPLSCSSKPRNMYENPATNVVQRPMKCHMGRRRSSGTMPVPLVE